MSGSRFRFWIRSRENSLLQNANWISKYLEFLISLFWSRILNREVRGNSMAHEYRFVSLLKGKLPINFYIIKCGWILISDRYNNAELFNLMRSLLVLQKWTQDSKYCSFISTVSYNLVNLIHMPRFIRKFK